MTDHLRYDAEPTPARFHASNAFFRGLMGPIGSGKSVACCMEVFLRAVAQTPTAGGVRKTRWAIIRNTYPELKSTTIKTWREWFPDSICPITFGAPITGHLQFPMADNTQVFAEVFFIALDKPKDLKKLLSLELTGAWVNEAREIPKYMIDMLSSRVGRFPAKKDAPLTWYGIFADTNPPATEHWWHDCAENGSWDVQGEHQTYDMDQIAADLYAIGYKDGDIETVRAYMAGDDMQELRTGQWEFFRQPGALIRDPREPRRLLPNPHAENVRHQPLGYRYWYGMLAGKEPEWIRVYILGEYGQVWDGRAVYEGIWASERHVSPRALGVYRGLPLRFCWDFGLTPACLVYQLSPKGQMRVLREYCCQNGGLEQFITSMVRPGLLNDFSGMAWVEGDCDPAGAQRSQADEVTCLDILQRHGFRTRLAPTNEFLARRQAVINLLMRTIGTEPGLIVDPSCKMLIGGFEGGYHFARKQVSGEEFKDAPEKNAYSHPHDALQYGCLRVDDTYSVVRQRPAVAPAVNTWGGRV